MSTQRGQCAWCGFVYRAGSEPTSHGVCERCLAQYFSDVSVPKDDDLGRTVPLESESGLNFAEVERCGHRWEQVVFSAAVVAACLLGGALVGGVVALLEAWRALP